MPGQGTTCESCKTINAEQRIFCRGCGTFLRKDEFKNRKVYEMPEMKIMRIVENLSEVPHSPVIWSDTVDLYTRKVEKFRSLLEVQGAEGDKNEALCDKMEDFLTMCHKPEFQIAFVGTIKTGKSTLINSLLGHNYASMAVTPETAALTKFRSSPRDCITVTFYSRQEWEKLWKSRSSAADAFMKEYRALKAEAIRDEWVGHAPIYRELENDEIEHELAVWSSSKRAEHYFVKEIEVGISNLPKTFPEQVVFVDTPGLSDPVSYRSEITKQYIRKANAVFVCVDAQKVQKDEIETISSVFSFSSHNKSKVHIIATHWDKLNDPENDWKEQKEWLVKRLVGKGFFESSKMANQNIMYSAAHIYNLCRDFETLSKKEKYPLMQLALLYDINPDFQEKEDSLDRLREVTNIDNIGRVISDHLIRNYRELLNEDIGKKYKDIIFDLKRYASDTKEQMEKIIEISGADRKAIERKVEEQKKNYTEVRRCQEQLEAALASVEKGTGKRLKEITAQLDRMAKNG